MSEKPTTAIVKVEPESDAVVKVLYSEGLKQQEYARALVIGSDADIQKATEFLGIIKRHKDSMELERTSYTKPMNDYLRVFNATFKQLAGPNLDADAIVRQKILAYQAVVRAEIAEQERINEAKAQIARDEMALKGELSEPIGLVEVSPEWRS
ncbi:hypothetical protein LCGC14_1517400, partial [marine sediment metagenome]